ncbi:aspartate aminotransferase [Paramyrothecium foliicola]|nr:aspartate aminotransferase [Paramyrothecium foliicola]
MTSSCFSTFPKVVTDEVFDLLAAFRADAHPDRVNLGAGVYCTDDGQSWPLDVVSRVEAKLHKDSSPNRHDYLPIEGDREFVQLARDLIFFSGEDASVLSDPNRDSRIASVQTVSGTGANHMGARFVADHVRPQHAWLPDPTWANHHTIWETVGITTKLYPYYKASDCTFDFDAMMRTLEAYAQPRDVLVLHTCAHNPTGLDPSKEQWMAIADICQRKQLLPFFDTAYQGFASGNPVQDVWAIRYFYRQQPRLEMLVAQSFSKNFGLYGQRTGALHLVLGEVSAETRSNAFQSLQHLLRSEISMAPKYGSTVVKTVLNSKELTAAWMADLQVMSSRIRNMRHALYDELIRLGTPGTWNHIIGQIGMFSYTGLTKQEVTRLRVQFHIYMLASGRISISGLNTRNVQYVARAIHEVKTTPDQFLNSDTPNGTNGITGTNGLTAKNGH